MRQRYPIVIFFAAVALLFPAIFGHSRSTNNPSKSPAKNKIGSSRRSTQLNTDHMYAVRRGDTLYRIAQAFGTTPEALQSANGLRSTTIEIGQKLRIPPRLDSTDKSSLPKEARAPFDPNELSISAGVSQEGENQASDAEVQPLRMRLVEAGFKWIGVRYRRSGGSEESGQERSQGAPTLSLGVPRAHPNQRQNEGILPRRRRNSTYQKQQTGV